MRHRLGRGGGCYEAYPPLYIIQGFTPTLHNNISKIQQIFKHIYTNIMIFDDIHDNIQYSKSESTLATFERVEVAMKHAPPVCNGMSTL